LFTFIEIIYLDKTGRLPIVSTFFDYGKPWMVLKSHP